MTLPDEIQKRWLANLAAAGIEPDTATIERVSRDVAERQMMLRDVLERLDCRGVNPDYLRQTAGKERGGGDL
ncbi:MAG TPA: hypothetical protein VKZ96_20000 [Thermomicrobiales bacterium]|nr:hypothetical protein [Thermomicrobiales bacterium]